MNAIECIKTRRSVRNFKDKEVSLDDIKSIVEIASYSPSWKNSQTPSYIAVLDKEIKEKLSENCMMGFQKNSNTVKFAPAVIVVTTLNGVSGYTADKTFQTSKGTHWQSFDAGVAAQTFCLAAHDLGLSTVILGVFDEEKVSEVLNIPKTHSVSALIALGYNEVELKAPKRKTVDELLKVK